VKTSGGHSFSSTVYAPRGSAVNGIEWSDVDGKFKTLGPMAGISPSNIEKCTQVMHSFRDVKHVRELVELIG
jgi:hypothetical protein